MLLNVAATRDTVNYNNDHRLDLYFWSAVLAVPASGLQLLFNMNLALCTACLITAAFVFHQKGLQTVSAGKSSFIAGMSVIFAPAFQFSIPCFGRQLTLVQGTAVVISLFGLLLLSDCVPDWEVCFSGEILSGESAVFLGMLLASLTVAVADEGVSIASYQAVM